MGKFLLYSIPVFFGLSNFWTQDLLASYTGCFVQGNPVYHFDECGDVQLLVEKTDLKSALIALRDLEITGKLQ